MKKIVQRSLGILSVFLLTTKQVLAQTVDDIKADPTIWNSEKLAPVKKLGNYAIAIIAGIALFAAIIRVAVAGFKLQYAGTDPMKQDAAKKALSSAITGLIITLCAVAIVAAVVFALTQAGIKL